MCDVLPYAPVWVWESLWPASLMIIAVPSGIQGFKDLLVPVIEIICVLSVQKHDRCRWHESKITFPSGVEVMIERYTHASITFCGCTQFEQPPVLDGLHRSLRPQISDFSSCWMVMFSIDRIMTGLGCPWASGWGPVASAHSVFWGNPIYVQQLWNLGLRDALGISQLTLVLRIAEFFGRR